MREGCYIEDVYLRKILDSRGNPTIEAEVITEDGVKGIAAAPSGASTGKYEAKVIPVDEAIEKAEEKLISELIGICVFEQEYVDEVLREVDGTENFSQIGGNTAIAISMAVAKAAANSLQIPLYRYLGTPFSSSLPYPLGNVIGGGAHAEGATSIQEFLSIPVGASSVLDAVFANAAVHKKVKSILSSEGIFCGKGDEGAWAPQISDEKAFEIMKRATEEVSDELGFEIRFGVDVAASELWDGENYVYKDVRRSPEEQLSFIGEMIDRYQLYYVEDPFHEEDFESFAELTSSVKALICGDDLFVTNVERIRKGIELKAGNAVLIKPNQIGTLTDTFRAVSLAREHGYTCVISHRSGETTDNTIAHLAVALELPIIKTGVVGGERIAKLNELIRIEEELVSPKMASLRKG
ncbi:MAG: enolase [Archaeoglobi archaeon]|nr:phosphopyruvate hydratase [Candidatus Mnemosynella bozhongmuii]MDK2782166.1 enolase [Archaeoglobi archaeon]